MRLIELTQSDHGEPPVAITEAGWAIKPRRQLRPDVANQDPRPILSWSGAQVTLPSGAIFNVQEDYDEVVKRLRALGAPGPVKATSKTAEDKAPAGV